tara:strand:- start:238 stop:399 length:162 start_codon:yes stop_codon:yes gene_type:complete
LSKGVYRNLAIANKETTRASAPVERVLEASTVSAGEGGLGGSGFFTSVICCTV